MSEHTPGPWGLSSLGFATNDGAIPVMAETADGDRKRVALVDCQVEFKRGKGYEAQCPERNANARLIAAAPDLLAALQFIVAHISDPKRSPRDLYPAFGLNSGQAVKMAHAAIARATTPTPPKQREP